MFDDTLHILTLTAALGCGLIGGAFFAFSTFIMKALAQLPPPQGIAAMQSINAVVINPRFMTALFGPAVLCGVLAAYSFSTWQQPGGGFLLAGSLLYLVGTIVVTIAGNVPLNNALAGVDPASTEGARVWAGYVPRWTAWNHVRTAAALAASALLTMWLCLPGVA